MLKNEKEDVLIEDEQASSLKKLITFQETKGDVFDPIRDRLYRPESRLRRKKQTISFWPFDIIVDNYISIIDLVDEVNPTNWKQHPQFTGAIYITSDSGIKDRSDLP